jgi:NAD(P)-dependent dehydrogenase (short-subunit alcohol dehydrogenase family)
MHTTGEKVLVVGASSGIGLETARLFAARGAQVTISARSKGKLEALAAELGKDCHVVIGDVGDVASCQAIVPAAILAMSGLDSVVYCAGMVEPCLVKEMTVESFKRHLDVNLTGNFIVAQAAALYMQQQQGGSIVNLSSELGQIGLAHYVHYCASKAGVLGLTRALAVEFAPHIRVNAVSPGPVDTPMMQEELRLFGGTQQILDEAIARVPLKRFATAVEVARAIVFLTVDAPYATGSNFALDGGTTTG